MKIVIDENIPYAKKLFSNLGDVHTVSGRNISRSILAQANVLIVRSVTCVDSNLLDGSKVKFVGTATSGIDHIDTEWLMKAGISFYAAHGCNTIAVVEYVFSSLLYLAQKYSFSLLDKSIGIVGVGNIGKCLKQRLNAFGVHTILCDPLLKNAGVPGDWQPLEKLIAEADILTLHTPLTNIGDHATWHLVNKDVLDALPDNRILINTCRGGVIDNIALLQSCKKGKHIGLVLDVWEFEPEILFQLLPYVDIGTPHIAGYTLEGKIRGTIQVFESYNFFIGNHVNINLETLLPLSIIDNIQVRGDINEELLRLLACLIYDIKRDDIQLRSAIELHNEFDLLRKHYYQRREWSSLYVKHNNFDNKEILRQLGFSIR